MAKQMILNPKLETIGIVLNVISIAIFFCLAYGGGLIGGAIGGAVIYFLNKVVVRWIAKMKHIEPFIPDPGITGNLTVKMLRIKRWWQRTLDVVGYAVVGIGIVILILLFLVFLLTKTV